MQSEYFLRLWKYIRAGVNVPGKSELMWNDYCIELSCSLYGLPNVYIAKTASTLKRNALVAYPLHVILLNLTSIFRSYVIENGYRLVRFLLVEYETVKSAEDQEDADHSTFVQSSLSCITAPLVYYVSFTYCGEGRERKMIMVHNALYIVLQSLREALTMVFIVQTKSKDVCNCLPILASNCSNIPERTYISSGRHGLSVIAPCTCCTVTVKDMTNGTYADMRNI